MANPHGFCSWISNSLLLVVMIFSQKIVWQLSKATDDICLKTHMSKLMLEDAHFQWKTNHLKMYLLFSDGDCCFLHCHVSFFRGM